MIFLFVAQVSLFSAQIAYKGMIEWSILSVFLVMGWLGLIMMAYVSPAGWILVDILTGNSHRLSKKYHGTGEIVAKYSTADDVQTRELTKEHSAQWPYGGWYVCGDMFVVVELEHEGQIFRSSMRLKKGQFSLAQPGSTIPVSYQLARGPDGPGAPILIWLR